MSSTTASASVTSSRLIFAKRLRELRVPRGFRTARSLAQAIGIDENRYTRYERAEVEPDLGLLMKMCDVLGLTPNDLLLDTTSAGQTPVGHRMSAEIGSERRFPPMVSPEYTAPPGFAETAQAPLTRERPSPSDQAAQSAASTASLKRRAVAWQLARLASAHGIVVGTAPTIGAGEIGSVQRTSRVFASIERDPFAFVTAMAAGDRIALLPDADQKRLAALVDELIAAVEAGAGG